MITQYRTAIPSSRKTNDDEISWNRLVGKTIEKRWWRSGPISYVDDILLLPQDLNGVPFITARKKD